MTTLNTVIWDQETNDASFANGPDYQIGVGSLDYVTGDIGGNVGNTMDVANVGIVRGTVVMPSSRPAAPRATRAFSI